MGWEVIFSETFIVSILTATIRMTAPILLAATGETFTQRSGVMNLGIEGMMLMGALFGFLTSSFTGNAYLGVLVAMIGVGLMSLILAYLSVTLGLNQVISGILIWILCTGIAGFLFRAVFGVFLIVPTANSLGVIDIPMLSQIPVLGPILFKHNFLVYISIILVPTSMLVLFRTTLGLKIRSVGENPTAADTLGVNVYGIRYLCIIVGGMTAGLAGAYLSIGVLNMFSEVMIAGRGWIAYAAVMFGVWNPYKVFGACLLFGLVDAAQLHLPVAGIEMPSKVLQMLPYIVAIIVLVVAFRRAKWLGALGSPYKRGEK
jgi:simple sugar transport system permease protein